MGETIQLTSADGFRLQAYRAPVTDARRGGLVVLHAVWGVTPHIRAFCDSLAEEGYETIAPSLFDRFEPGFATVDFDPARLESQTAHAEATGWGETTLPDVQAAIDALGGPVFLLGFCFGGTAAWLAACRLRGLSAVACFYGGHIVRHADETPVCPTLLHFGRHDDLIPPRDVEAIRERHPELPVHVYDAGHAFVAPSGYHADSARLARLRTLALFSNNGGGRSSI
ncbi:dienelactone hydrolase family protein [Phenylobacterium sp.]|uniref:dienelactone hydrolase family protein n=1 Tax=Phenylobacterium sp. TaxID=1871053 RepID=UPI002735CD4E|nr:dienelactone hydrolase family protein [Phenylobacterium sp.]MDP3853836.1 dienelactone hydrolase family protein [Phenylobacterium sp.]